MSAPGPSNDTDEFRDVLQESQHIVVLAGAGLSAASGVPTFRDGGGMWRSLDATTLATPAAFASNPSLVWQFYHYRRLKALNAQPNDAHRLLAKLSIPSYLKTIAPAAKTYHIVTQNVDRLSVVALESLARDLADKKSRLDRPRKDSILEMHGRLFDVKCTVCDYCVEDLTNPLCEALGAADSHLGDYHDAGSKPNGIPEAALPRCLSCHSLARPGVVWFGEKPLRLDDINSLIFKADLCIIVGTSLTVHPASTYMYRVQRHKGKVAVFNLDPTERDRRADFVFAGPCEVELPRVLGAVA
ncbi:NAD-dependent protein deacylase [Hypsizygus marmoreus]|uniref:NAD-dependent protein deacylase n=1 Tax=Hypsizygus marmoreus TaxID=39966 RepID=A0A369K4U0_HYPMA|nr:NAD-dependent protein deacylase [Hypsizygus marmoreus]